MPKDCAVCFRTVRISLTWVDSYMHLSTASSDDFFFYLILTKKKVNWSSFFCLSLLKIQADTASGAAQTHISRLSPREGKPATLGILAS